MQVIDPDGHTYEKAAVEHWIRANGESPVTRRALTLEELYENKAMLSVLCDLTSNSEESLPPSLAKWKEEHPSFSFPVPEPSSEAPPRPPREYPTTQAEINERRRQARCENMTTSAVLIACMLVFFFFPSYFFIFALVIACAWFVHEPYRRRQQEIRRQLVRDAAIREILQQEGNENRA